MTYQNKSFSDQSSISTVISHGKYCITYDEQYSKIHFEGAMRINGNEEIYQEIITLVESIAEKQPPSIMVDLRSLQFLNSLGISLLSKFVINVRKRKTIQLTILGSSEIPWQTKSLKNFQRLMPSLILEI